jgi:segregation and condensation protein A
MNDNAEYEVKLEMFEGPLDLLIHLIRKNEVDIFDIPIAIITDQYLEYLDMLKALNINVAGDFLVMASTLVHIKSKMLLPGYGEEEEEEDPRDEITGPLLEYLRLKEVAGELSERELLGRDVFKRHISLDYKSQFQGEDTNLEVNLFQLMDAFKKIIEQNLPGVPITFRAEKWSVKERMSFIMDQLKEKKTIYFKDLFKANRALSEFVVTFLALLELIHTGLIKIFQPEPYKDIRLEAHFKDNEDINYDEIIETHH